MPVSRCRAQALGRPRFSAASDQRSSSSFASDHGFQPVLGIVRQVGAAFQSIEDVDLRLVGQKGARGKPLAEMGDEEDAGARGPQRRRRPFDSSSIGVCLHHGRTTPGRGAIRELAPVVRQRVEIDCQMAGGVPREGKVGHESGFSITEVVG